ncbi:hypothetical protein QMZ05_27690 [Bradyrhizobium sp. INPA03-11B]|uniref:hypothetical protein n=1 Tax=Bradyrhizobium sp. INPA03-11B TaxID=418598 RepID=UPI00338F7E8C
MKPLQDAFSLDVTAELAKPVQHKRERPVSVIAGYVFVFFWETDANLQRVVLQLDDANGRLLGVSFLDCSGRLWSYRHERYRSFEQPLAGIRFKALLLPKADGRTVQVQPKQINPRLPHAAWGEQVKANAGHLRAVRSRQQPMPVRIRPRSQDRRLLSCPVRRGVGGLAALPGRGAPTAPAAIRRFFCRELNFRGLDRRRRQPATRQTASGGRASSCGRDGRNSGRDPFDRSSAPAARFLADLRCFELPPFAEPNILQARS